MKQDERGSIVVEATITFPIFVLVLLTFISLINVMYVYLRVQGAMTNTVSEISGYTYVYSALGGQEWHDETKALGDKVKENITGVLGGLSDLHSSAGGGITIENINSAYNDAVQTAAGVEAMLSDPISTLKGFVAWGLSDAATVAKSTMLGWMAKPLMEKYLADDRSVWGGSVTSGNDFLRGFGVVDGIDGLNFSQSKLFDDPDYNVIDLVATYTIKIPLSPIPLEVNMCQRAVTNAWLDGDGESYD